MPLPLGRSSHANLSNKACDLHRGPQKLLLHMNSHIGKTVRYCPHLPHKEVDPDRILMTDQLVTERLRFKTVCLIPEHDPCHSPRRP